MRLALGLATLSFAAAFVGPIACTSAEPASEEECESDSDCDDDEVCDDGECESRQGSSSGPGTTSSGPGGGPCTDGDSSCAGGDAINYCDGGEYVSFTCTDYCDYLGFESNGCSSDTCQCGDANNEVCYYGMAALCACYEASGGGSCTDDDFWVGYMGCATGEDGGYVSCWENFVDGDTVDCESAINSCG